MGVAVAGEIPSLTGEFARETHSVLEGTQTHPRANQHLKEHNLLVRSEGSKGKWNDSRAIMIVPFLTPPPQTAHLCNTAERVAPPWQISEAPPLTT